MLSLISLKILIQFGFVCFKVLVSCQYFLSLRQGYFFFVFCGVYFSLWKLSLMCGDPWYCDPV